MLQLISSHTDPTYIVSNFGSIKGLSKIFNQKVLHKYLKKLKNKEVTLQTLLQQFEHDAKHNPKTQAILKKINKDPAILKRVGKLTGMDLTALKNVYDPETNSLDTQLLEKVILQQEDLLFLFAKMAGDA